LAFPDPLVKQSPGSLVPKWKRGSWGPTHVTKYTHEHVPPSQAAAGLLEINGDKKLGEREREREKEKVLISTPRDTQISVPA
jgi:hypothetical protein